MRKTYVKPSIEIEAYTLDQTIAGNCQTIVSFGPEAPGRGACEEFEGSFDVMSVMAVDIGTSFYEPGVLGTCDCYYTSGGENYFTS